MTHRFNKLYPIVAAILLLCYVLTLVFPFIFGYADLFIVVYVILYEKIDEKNYIWLSVIFGLFADYVRGGFFGPAIILFLIFSLIRFKADVVMDMTKFNSKVILFAGISLSYCVFNLFLSGYSDDVIAAYAVLRTVFNVAIAVGIVKALEYRSAVKNA